MKIYVVGNMLVNTDNLPLRLLPELIKKFPNVSFEEADPNENFIPEEGSIIIDTVEGISRVCWFDSIDSFATTRSVSPHDYDLGFHLQLLKKLNRLRSIRIMGIPSHASQENIFSELQRVLVRDNAKTCLIDI